MSVYHLRYTGDDPAALALALDLALRDICDHRDTVDCWSTGTDEKGGYLLLGYIGSAVLSADHSAGWVPLPAPMLAAAAVPVVQLWLNGNEYPDCTYTGDGDAKKGYEVETASYHRNGIALVRIRPYWTIYGK